MKRLGRDDLYSSVRDGKVASQLEEPRTPAALALILTHIFLGRPEKPITMDVFVNQSTVAPGLSRCFIKPNCKMWVKDRPQRAGASCVGSVKTEAMRSTYKRSLP